MKKIRLGILLDSESIPAWAFEMLKRIISEDYASVDLLVVSKTQVRPSPAKPSSPIGILKELPGRVYDSVLDRSLERLFMSDSYSPNAFKKKNVRTILPDTPILEVTTTRTLFTDEFSDTDIETIKGYELDVLFRLGFEILKGEILYSARHGVWSYHHGDSKQMRGGPAVFWEFFESRDVVGSVLQVLTEELDRGLILNCSWASMDGEDFMRSKHRMYWKSSSFLPRSLKSLYELGAQEFEQKTKEQGSDPIFYANQLFQKPKGNEFAKLMLKKGVALFASKVEQKRYTSQWQLLLRMGKEMSQEFWRFKSIVPPTDRFWADPHVVARDDRYYVFIEEFIYEKGRGDLSVIEVLSDGTWAPPVTIIEEEHHLSYPHVVEADGQLYLVPEAYQDKCIPLYVCEEFPYKWKRIDNLMDNVVAVDSTIVQHNGTWYMFTGLKEVDGASACDELFLYWSDTFPTNNWNLHPASPIVSDVRSARPAGSILRHNGALYRPSQNCGKRYGYGLNLHKIENLSKDCYQESLITSAEPDWNEKVEGIHSYAFTPGITVADCLVKIRRS